MYLKDGLGEWMEDNLEEKQLPLKNDLAQPLEDNLDDIGKRLNDDLDKLDNSLEKALVPN